MMEHVLRLQPNYEPVYAAGAHIKEEDGEEEKRLKAPSIKAYSRWKPKGPWQLGVTVLPA